MQNWLEFSNVIKYKPRFHLLIDLKVSWSLLIWNFSMNEIAKINESIETADLMDEKKGK